MHAPADLIGREPELAALEQFLSSDTPGAIALTGPAGAGKTALTDWLCAQAGARGCRVVRAVGVEAEKSFTLGGLNQIVFSLRDLVAQLSPADRGAVAAVLDGLAAPAPMSLALSLVNLLEQAARDRPIAVVVDDAHWLDEPSAVVLGAVGRRLRAAGVSVAVALRPKTGNPFATAGWTELPVGPLGVADSQRLIDAVAPGLKVEVRAAILELAAGNPLALQELPRNAGLIGAAPAELPLTDRLVAVFGGRLAELGPEVRTELLCAALDGTKSSSVGDVGGGRYLMTEVRAALDADLLAVDPLGNTVFRHPLVRAAVIHQASAAQRRAAHQHLAGLYGDVLARRATHLSAAATEPDQQVADLLAEAARQSIRRGGAAVAVDWLRRAAELSTTAARRTELLTDAAFVAAQSSRFDDAATIADDEPAATALTGAYLSLYRDGEVRAAHHRVLGLLRRSADLDDETLSRAVTLLLAMTQYAADPGLWGQTADAIAGLGSRVDERSLLYRDAWGDLARTGHTVRQRLAEYADELDTFEPWEVMRLGVVAYYVDALADFRVTLRRLLERERDRGAVTNAMTMQHLVVLDLIRSGQWADAERMGRDGLELTRAHRSELFGYQFTAYQGVLAACTGDLETARRCAAAVLTWAGSRHLGLLLGYAHRTAVLVALAEGDYATAYAASVRLSDPGVFTPFVYQAV
ncbi:MAG TPA: ATP-binding protein, partial [Mycobacterium sp.]|nr:ATP-binding protein [Mycobacterium sp.]